MNYSSVFFWGKYLITEKIFSISIIIWFMQNISILNHLALSRYHHAIIDLDIFGDMIHIKTKTNAFMFIIITPH